MRDDETLDFDRDHDPTAPFGETTEEVGVELHWLTLKLLDLIGGNPRLAIGLDPRLILLSIERRSEEESDELAAHLSRGLYLMAHGLHRAALVEFEAVLDGRADGDLEPFPRLALEAHAFALLRIGCDSDALRELERLFDQEVADEEEPDDLAELRGATRAAAPAG